jgi:hypothetical protein
MPTPLSTPPRPLNPKALFMTRGDIFAGETKTVREPTSTQVERGASCVALCVPWAGQGSRTPLSSQVPFRV